MKVHIPIANSWTLTAAALACLGASDAQHPQPEPPPPNPAPPMTQTIRIPLTDDGRVPLGALLRELARATGGESTAGGNWDRFTLPARGVQRVLTARLIQETLGPGLRAELDGDALLLHVDTQALRDRQGEFRQRIAALRTKLTRDSLPTGLHARPSYRPGDPDRPTVCIIHGIDATARCWDSLAPMLEDAGFGVVVFQYPFEQPIAASASRLARDFAPFRDQYGDFRSWIVVTHSMGGLVARAYLENDQLYDGGVHRLIMLAPPNHGSNLAKLRATLATAALIKTALKYDLSLWPRIGEPRGDSAADMTPGSDFLTQLNARPRRPGVRYSIIAGDHFYVSPELWQRLARPLESARSRPGRLADVLDKVSLPPLAEPPELIKGKGDGAVSPCIPSGGSTTRDPSSSAKLSLRKALGGRGCELQLSRRKISAFQPPNKGTLLAPTCPRLARQ